MNSFNPQNHSRTDTNAIDYHVAQRAAEIIERYELPEFLDLPTKLVPLVIDFNDFKYFLCVGGRGGGKSQAVGRFLLFLGEQRKLRIVCGRELQANIEESVYTLLVDIINKNDLNYHITKQYILHRKTGTKFTFKGFRNHGAVNIKGLEGVDIVWIDEAEQVTEEVLRILVPTIRKQNARLFFTMNRKKRKDKVPEFLQGRTDAMKIVLNYYDNHHCPEMLKVEAEECRKKSEAEWRHIWGGEPEAMADGFLFNFDDLYNSLRTPLYHDAEKRHRVLGVDFAAQGSDFNVATLIERDSTTTWRVIEKVSWQTSNTDLSKGKIIGLIGKYNADVTVIDKCGNGYAVFDQIQRAMPNKAIVGFNGAEQAFNPIHNANMRAEAYRNLKNWFEKGYIKIDEKDKDILEELEYIKFDPMSDRLLIEKKAKMKLKGDLGVSPDKADSLKMAVWGAQYKLDVAATSSKEAEKSHNVKRTSGSKRRKVIKV